MDAPRQPEPEATHAPTSVDERSGIGPRIVLAVLAMAIVGAFVWREMRPEPTAKSGGRGPASAMPVVTAVATESDVPTWLRGLGSVRAWNTVTVRPRVGGELLRVVFTEGQDVKAGDLLAEIDPRPYEIARDRAVALLARDEARLGAAKKQAQSSRDLVAARAAGRLERDLDAASVAELEATVRGDRAELATAKLQLEYTKVAAPIAGRVGLRMVDAGNVVAADDARGIATITQLQPISVVFSVPQDHLPALQAAAASKTPPVVEAIGDGDRLLATGTLATIDSLVDAATGTISVKATFPNEGLRLWPGQLLAARIAVGERASAISIPEQAVVPGAAGPMLYVVDGAGIVEVRPVQLGPTQGGMTIIEAGLVAGERVVIEGQAKLSPGSEVTEMNDPTATAGGTP